jgi:hypothetical protein
MTEPLRGACAAARKRIGGPRRSPHARRSPLRLALRARLRAYLRAPHPPPRTTPQRTRLSPGVAITARTQGTPYGRSSCNTGGSVASGARVSRKTRPMKCPVGGVNPDSRRFPLTREAVAQTRLRLSLRTSSMRPRSLAARLCWPMQAGAPTYPAPRFSWDARRSQERGSGDAAKLDERYEDDPGGRVELGCGDLDHRGVTIAQLEDAAARRRVRRLSARAARRGRTR